MSDNPALKKDDSNGDYKFDPNAARVGLGAATIGFLFFGSLGIWAGLQGGFTSIAPFGSLLLCLGSVGVVLHVARLSGRNLQVSDDGISVRDKQGRLIGSIHWIELAKVTERRRMAQLALWDKSWARRVLVDQQFENFAVIRSRILAEYAKAFILKPLPIEFRNPNPLLFESVLFGAFTAFWSWASWSSYHQGQTVLSVIALCLAVASLLFLLNLYPQIAGPSELFEDRIVLRSLFKTKEIYKKDVFAVELEDVANPRSGTKFSFVLLKVTKGKPLRITTKFGSIPELYLTLRAWLAQSRS